MTYPDLYSNILWSKSIIGLAEIDKTGKFLRANPAFCDLLGYSESELQAKHWQDITHPEDTDGGEQMFNRTIAGLVTSYAMEKRYITKRGQIIWVNLYVTGIPDDKGNVKFLLKQIINTPILIPAEGTLSKKEPQSVKEIVKDNSKIILASIVGTVFAIYGAWQAQPEIKNIGLAIVVGLFGGMMANKK